MVWQRVEGNAWLMKNNNFLVDWITIMKLVFKQQLKIILPIIYMISGGLVVISSKIAISEYYIFMSIFVIFIAVLILLTMLICWLLLLYLYKKDDKKT